MKPGDQHEAIVPPGEYQLSSSAVGSENQWIIWPQKVEVRAGSGTSLKIDSSMHLDLAPELGNPLWRWAVTPFGNPSQTIQWQSEDERTIILPPGEYQLSSSARGSENQWIVWPQKVQVRAGQQTKLRIDTSLKVNLPPDARNLLWRWEVVRFGRPDPPIQSQPWGPKHSRTPCGGISGADVDQGGRKSMDLLAATNNSAVRATGRS